MTPDGVRVFSDNRGFAEKGPKHRDITFQGLTPDGSKPSDGRPDFAPLCSEDLKVRMELAEALAEAIAEAHPDDACQLMTGALIDLSAGIPSGAVFIDAEDDALWWASIATPAELVAVLTATLRALGNTALHVSQRKRLFMQLWRSFSAEDRARFLSYAKGEV